MTVEGEVIRDADIRLGYNHRGLEKLAEEKTYIQNIYLTERICGICSHSHTTCFVQGVEKLMELEPPKRGAVHPLPRRRARAGPQPPALARRRRPRGRLRHVLHVHLARPRGRHGPPGDDLRQPRPLRHQHHRRRPPRHRRGQKAEDPRRRRRSSEAQRILLPDRRHRADLRRPHRRRRPPDQGAGRSSLCAVGPDGPRLGHRPRRPQGRPLRRLRRTGLRGRHRRQLRRPRPASSSASRSSCESYKIIEQILRKLPDGPDRRQGAPQGQAERGRQPLRSAPRREHPLHQVERHGQARAAQGPRPDAGQLPGHGRDAQGTASSPTSR